jgi:uncharacterized membrane protein
MTKLSLVVLQILMFGVLLKINNVPIVASDVTYTKDAKPIFKERCAMCHNENMPEKNWMDYNQAFKKKDLIKIKMMDKSMPPGNSTNMTEKERQIVINWVDGGGKK